MQGLFDPGINIIMSHINSYKGVITVSFGDHNHTGERAAYTVEELKMVANKFKNVEWVRLNDWLPGNIVDGEEALVLIVRDGLEQLGVDHWRAYEELSVLDWDRKGLSYGRLVNKHARWHLRFGETARDPAYLEGKGRIVEWSSVPLLGKVNDTLPEIMGEASRGLDCYSNYYYDLAKCGIGFHGDTERRKAAIFRFGGDAPLVYQWYVQGKQVGSPCKIQLKGGDFYFMTSKAVGWDWKRRKVPTLRHAAGGPKYVP